MAKFRFRPTGHVVAIARDRHGGAHRVNVGAGSVFESNLKVKVIRDAQYEDLLDGSGKPILDLNGKPVQRYIEGTGTEREITEFLGGNWFHRLWYRLLYRGKTELDLGSGMVTNAGVLAMANDYNWASPSAAAINTLKLANWHATGTGANAEATTDISLQTASANGGQTPVAGTQSLISAANLQKYRSVATINYTGTENVTEWILLTDNFLTQSTGTPFTAGSATTGTVTGTPLTASSTTVQGQQQHIFHNTGNATPHWGLVISNTTSVVTVPAWYKVTDGTAGGPPANTDAYVIRPVPWDRRKFAAIGVVNGDSIQFTYTLTINSGG